MKGRVKNEQEFIDGWLTVQGKRHNFLQTIDGLMDWKLLEGLVEPLYSKNGRPSHPPVVLFKMLLIQHFYNLSDVACEEAVRDSLSFRSFCGLKLNDLVPDSTSLVNFRKRLTQNNLHDKLLEQVNQCLMNHGLLVRRVTLVDATLIKAATRPPSKEEPPKEPEASFTIKNEQVHYGYKAHVAAEASTDMIQRVELTTAKVHDSQVFEQLDDGTTPVAADKAYDSKERQDRLGERSYIMLKAARGRPLCPLERAYNKAVSAVRCRIEKIFGHWKRSLGYRVSRYRGRVKGRLELELKSVCWNLRRAVTFVTP